jgi:hypothetical protein
MEHRRKITHFFLPANMLVRYHCVTVNYIKRGLRATPLHCGKQCAAANHKNHQNHPKITVQTTPPQALTTNH